MRLDRFPSAQAHRPLYPAPRGRRPRAIRILLRLVGILALLVVILVGAAAAILAAGPVELNALRDRVTATLDERLGPGYAARVTGASIDVDPVLGLVVQIDDITIRDSGDAVVATVPAARLAIDPVSFLKLRVDIRTVEISQPEISLVRGLDGRIYLGAAATIERNDAPAEPPPPKPPGPDVVISKVDGGFPDLFTALRILNAGLEPAVDAAFERNFERFSVDAATIQIFDAKKLQQRVFPHTDITLAADSATKAVKASFSTSGYSGRWGILAERTVDAATRDRQLTLSFSQLALADIEPNFGRPESLLTSDIPLYGRATVRLAENGDVKDAAVRFDLGAGNVVSGFGHDTVLLDEATIRLHWDVAQRALVIEPSSFFFGDTRGVVSGSVKPMSEASDGRYAFSLESRGFVLAARDAVGARPIIADRIALIGTADFAAKRIDFSDASLTTSEGSVAAAGSLGLDGPTPSLAMAASFTPMPLNTLKQIWPPILAGPARLWVMQHVTAGNVDAGRFEAAVPAGVLWTGQRVRLPEDYMRLDAKISGVSFTTIGNVPPVTNVSGNAVVAGSTFGVDMEQGQITAPSGKTVQITAGAFAVSDTSVAQAQGQVEAQFEGDIGAMAEIANSQPMRAMERQKIDPANLSGTGQGSLSIKMPMKPGLLPSDVDWRATLQTSDFASAAPIDGKIIRNGAFSMTATAREVTIKGKATINGVPASIDLVQPTGDSNGDGEADGGGRRQVSLLLDADARKRLGIGLDNVLGGTVGVIVGDLEDGRKGQHYELDLKQARIVLQAVGWSKGIGVPAKLSFDMLPRDDGFAIENMVATGDGFGFKGKAELDAKYGLVSADLDRFALRKGDQVSVRLLRKGNGYQIAVRGAAFDVRGLITQYKSSAGGASEGAADISVDAKIDALTGFDQVTLQNADFEVETDGGTVTRVALSGSLPQGAVSMDFSDTGNAATLKLDAADGGNLLGFVDLYRRIAGGRMTLTGARRGASGAFSGVFDLSDFSIVHESSMQRLVSATNGSGANAQPTGLNPDNVPFSRMRLDYTKRNSVIVIDDAVLRGASVGATLNGTIDLARQQISLAGTYLPAYAFNNLFGRLPLIGLALGGGSQGGLFGVTFKIEGPIGSPSLTVNPLSMITPGIFRKIFEFPVD